MTNHRRPPPPSRIRHRSTDGGPPTDADGLYQPFPPSNTGLATQVLSQNARGDRWEFVAAPRPAGMDVASTLQFLALIKLNNLSTRARFYSYDEFPEELENAQVTVTNAPSGGYDLSRYWVASYYLGPEDSIALPTAGAVPSGIATWTQAVRKLTA